MHLKTKLEIYEPKSVNTAKRNKQIHNCSQRIQYTLPIIDRTSRQKKKIIKDIEGMNNQLNLMDIYRKFQPTIPEYIFFSTTYETFTAIGHILGHKT